MALITTPSACRPRTASRITLSYLAVSLAWLLLSAAALLARQASWPQPIATHFLAGLGLAMLSAWIIHRLARSEQRYAAAAQTESLDRMRLAQAQRVAHIGSWEWDIANDTVSGTEELYRIHGLSVGTPVTFRGFLERVHPDDRERVKDRLLLAYTDYQPFKMAYRILRPDGDIRTLLGQGEVVRDETGKPLRIVGVGQDISERQSAQDALAASEERFRLLVDGVKDYAIFMLDPEGRIVSWNDGAGRIYGYTSEEILSKHLSSFYAPEDLPAGKPEQELAVAAATGRYEEQGWRVRKDGTHFFAHAIVTALRTDDGTLRGFAKVTRDITRVWRQEQELRRLNHTLKVISRSNSILVHVDNEKKLIEQICRSLVDIGGYRFVWVAFAERDDARTLRVAGSAGHGDGYLEAVPLSWAENGNEIAGAVIRTGRLVVLRHIARELINPVVQREALARGYASVLALPLSSGEGIFGALTIFAGEPDAFDAEETELLLQLAADLSYGISALQARRLRHEAEKAVQIRQRVIEASSNGIVMCDPNRPGTPIVYANPALLRMSGRDETKVLGNPVEIVFGEDFLGQAGGHQIREAFEKRQEARAVLRILRGDGSAFWGDFSVYPVETEDGQERLFVLEVEDITERIAYEQQLEFQATHDSLTGLANRNLLADRVEQAVAQARRTESCFAVLVMDIDRFKVINDTLGHSIGDGLLKAVSTRIQGCTKEGDTVARMGGDEFALVVNRIKGAEEIAPIASRILSEVARRENVFGHDLAVSGSMGVALYPQDGEQLEILLKNADTAMYRAKQSGAGSFQLYSPEMNVRALQWLQMETGLRQALERNELQVYYQPKIDMKSGTICGAEALVRWNHPSRGLISPVEFIPIAEETGMIQPIGEWVISTVCRQNGAWQKAGLGPIDVAVNLSARQFHRPTLLASIIRALESSGLEARYLELELTESAVMENPLAARESLLRLKDLGVDIALDDFGTGYSSLSYLKKFPIDKLKIDQSFVKEIATSPQDAAIIDAVIAMAHGLGMQVIAEGVETQEQLLHLADDGCDQVQGYYYSKPVPADSFVHLLQRDGTVM